MLIEDDFWCFSSIMTERYDYVAREVRGNCLDVGCGKFNKFIVQFLDGKGVGIDVFKYEGLTDENVVADLTSLPYPDGTFDSVTFIANINHVPLRDRDKELSEAYRCLAPGGNIIITMGNPLAEILAHKVVHLRDKIFGSTCDVDSIRGMDEEEEYYLLDKEIIERMEKAGFTKIKKKYFLTQWGLNHMFIGWK